MPTTVVITATGAGSITVPTGVTSAVVECWGPGYQGDFNNGGGGGAYSKKTALVTTPGASLSYFVGAGGISNTSSPSGDTWFGSTSTVLAKAGGDNTGGQASAGVGDVKYSGGNAINGVWSFDVGGGASASSFGNGGHVVDDTTGANGYASPGGDSPGAGAGGTSYTNGVSNVEGGGGGGAHAAGGAPGGGGGEYAGTPAPAGNGARGQIRITWADPVVETVVVITATGAGSIAVPTGVTTAKVECWGPGTIQRPTGGAIGGGGGAYSCKNSLTVTPGATMNYFVGAGMHGIAAAAENDYVGSVVAATGDTWFGSTSTVLAKAASGTTTAGGQASAGVGDVKYSGGAGGPDGAVGGGSASKNGNGGAGIGGGPGVEKGGDSPGAGAGSGTTDGVSNVEGGGGGAFEKSGGAPGGGGGAFDTDFAYDDVHGGRGQLRITWIGGSGGEPDPELNALTPTTASISNSAAINDTVLTITNQTSGSTLSLHDDDGGRFNISGAVVRVNASLISSAGTRTIVVRETLTGATNTPRDTTMAITVTAPTLASLSPTSASIADSTSINATALTITNQTSGSTLSLTNNDGGRFNISGNLVRVNSSLIGTSGARSITVRETLTGATNTPRDTNMTITVTVPTLAALTLSNSTVGDTAATSTVVGAINGEDASSTLSLTNDDGGRFAISNGNLVVNASLLGSHGTRSVTIRETRTGATNTPRDTTLNVTVVEAFKGPAYIGAGTAGSGTGNVTYAMPAGITTGDLLVLAIETANQNVATPSGWTLLAPTPVGFGTAAATTATRLTVFTKVAAASNPNVAVSDPGDHQYGRVFAFGPSEIDVIDGAGVDSPSGFMTSIYPTGENRRVVSMVTVPTDTTAGQVTWGNHLDNVGTNNSIATNSQVIQNAGATAGNGGGLSVATTELWSHTGYYNRAFTRTGTVGVALLQFALKNIEAATATGTATASIAAISGSATGNIKASGTGTAAIATISGSASGTSLSPATGTGSANLGAMSGAASGTSAISGSATGSLASISVSGTSALRLTGTGSAALAPMVGADDAELGLDGSSTGALAGLSGTATGTSAISGTASASQTMSVAITATETLKGTAQASLQGAVAEASGVLGHPVAVTALLDAPSGFAMGAEAISGTAASTIGAFDADAWGFCMETGYGSATISGLEAAATGTQAVPTYAGIGAANLGELSGAATGTSSISATGAADLVFQASATGAESLTGAAAATLDAFISYPSAIMRERGSATASVQAISGSGTGSETLSGVASADLTGLSGSANGVHVYAVAGGAQAFIPSLTGAASGSFAITATATATIPALTGTATTVEAISGSASSDLGAMVAAATGTHRMPVQDGEGFAVLGSVTATASGSSAERGSASATLAGFSGAALATVATAATGAAEISGLSSSANADIKLSGSATAEIIPFNASAQATGAILPHTATASGTLEGLSADAQGALAITAIAASVMGALSGRGFGFNRVLEPIAGQHIRAARDTRQVRAGVDSRSASATPDSRRAPK